VALAVALKLPAVLLPAVLLQPPLLLLPAVLLQPLLLLPPHPLSLPAPGYQTAPYLLLLLAAAPTPLLAPQHLRIM